MYNVVQLGLQFGLWTWIDVYGVHRGVEVEYAACYTVFIVRW